jgi:hypothetical protein
VFDVEITLTGDDFAALAKFNEECEPASKARNWLGWISSRDAGRAAREFAGAEPNRWLFQPHRLRLTAQGVSVVGDGYQLHQCWPLVWKIEATPDYLFLYTTTVMAHIVPRRAFREGQHFDDFVTLARLYHQGRGPAAAVLSRQPPDLWDPNSSY